MSKDHYSFDKNQKSWQREDIANIERQARVETCKDLLEMSTPIRTDGRVRTYGLYNSQISDYLAELEREE